VATIEAAANRSLGHLSFDLAGMTVSGVTVGGEPAGFSRGGDKLRVVPATPLAAKRPFVAVVDYGGTPRSITDSAGPTEGWIRTDDGAIGIGEPVGTPVWMPCNNTLTDKASFGFHITVPRRLKGVANGRLLSVSRDRTRKTFEWSESQPMAPYLAAINIGRGKLVRSVIEGIPAWTMVDPRLAGKARAALRPLPEIVRFESELFGPYPFDALGATVDLTERSPSRPRRGRSSASCPTSPSSCMSSRTSGSATRSGSGAGPTSGSTRASRPGSSGTTASATVALACVSSSSRSARNPRESAASGSPRPDTPAIPRSCSSTRSTYAER
jgi:hypothetical protein